VACPIDSWIVSHRFVGSTTRSYTPGSTDGAATFSASSAGSRASSPSQSQPVPSRYSQPRPTGGAVVRIDSNAPVSRSTATAVTVASTRTRRWVSADPARSAKNLSSRTPWKPASTWSTDPWSSSRWLHPASSATFSASGTSNGSTSYAERQLRSPAGGSAARTTGRDVTGLQTRATSTARSASSAAASGVSATPAAKPHVPSCTTRTEIPVSRSSLVASVRPSRRWIRWSRIRSARKSACSAPSWRARRSAESAIARRGSAANVRSVIVEPSHSGGRGGRRDRPYAVHGARVGLRYGSALRRRPFRVGSSHADR
jgi:hypothetical protein